MYTSVLFFSVVIDENRSTQSAIFDLSVLIKRRFSECLDCIIDFSRGFFYHNFLPECDRITLFHTGINPSSHCSYVAFPCFCFNNMRSVQARHYSLIHCICFYCYSFFILIFGTGGCVQFCIKRFLCLFLDSFVWRTSLSFFIPFKRNSFPTIEKMF